MATSIIQKFPRKKIIGSISFLIALMIMSRGLRLHENSLVPEFMYYIVASLFFIYSLWIYFVAYISIDDNYIIVNESPFKRYIVEIKELKEINISSDVVHLRRTTANTVIKLTELSETKRNDLITTLKGLSLN